MTTKSKPHGIKPINKTNKYVLTKSGVINISQSVIKSKNDFIACQFSTPIVTTNANTKKNKVNLLK